MLNYADLPKGTVLGHEWTTICKKGKNESGVQFYKFRHTCGAEITTAPTSIRAGRKCRVCNGDARKIHAATKCWDCAKAVLGCSWSKSFIPVEGWTAVPTMVNGTARPFGGSAKAERSFHVMECPEFVPDPPREVSLCW